MVPDAAADGFGSLPFGKFLPLVAALHADIFMFYLMDFPVGKQQYLGNGAACRVRL